MTRYMPKKNSEHQPGTAMPFRTRLNGVTLYHLQVWKPSFEDGEVLREAGFQPMDGGNEKLEHTMVWYTIDPESAFNLATPEQWEESPVEDAEAIETFSPPDGMTDEEWSAYAQKLAADDDQADG